MSKALPDASVELNCLPSTILASAADMLPEATVSRAARATAATELPACCSWRCAIARTESLVLLHLACRDASTSGACTSGACSYAMLLQHASTHGLMGSQGRTARAELCGHHCRLRVCKLKRSEVSRADLYRFVFSKVKSTARGQMSGSSPCRIQVLQAVLVQVGVPQGGSSRMHRARASNADQWPLSASRKGICSLCQVLRDQTLQG